MRRSTILLLAFVLAGCGDDPKPAFQTTAPPPGPPKAVAGKGATVCAPTVLFRGPGDFASYIIDAAEQNWTRADARVRSGGVLLHTGVKVELLEAGTERNVRWVRVLVQKPNVNGGLVGYIQPTCYEADT